MVGVKAQSTKQRRFKRTILVIFWSLLLFSGSAGARIPLAQTARSCSSLRSMARIYMACGGYGKAQPLLKKALHLAEQTNAPDTEVCACVIDLAYLYKEQGKLADAETMCQLGLELQQKVYHEDHPYVAYTLRILSEIYRGQGRYPEASSALERALDIVRRVSRGSEQEVVRQRCARVWRRYTRWKGATPKPKLWFQRRCPSRKISTGRSTIFSSPSGW